MLREAALFVVLAMLSATLPLQENATSGPPALAGAVSDAFGDPLPGVQVTFAPDAGGKAMSTSTGRTGAYHIENVPVGSGRLTFELPGFVADWLAVQVMRDVPVLERNVSLRLASLVEAAGSMRGLVVNEQGAPIPGAAVWILALGGASGARQDATTSQAGAFDATLLYEGDYVVCARSRGYLPACATFRDYFHATYPRPNVRLVLRRAPAAPRTK